MRFHELDRKSASYRSLSGQLRLAPLVRLIVNVWKSSFNVVGRPILDGFVARQSTAAVAEPDSLRRIGLLQVALGLGMRWPAGDGRAREVLRKLVNTMTATERLLRVPYWGTKLEIGNWQLVIRASVNEVQDNQEAEGRDGSILRREYQ